MTLDDSRRGPALSLCFWLCAAMCGVGCDDGTLDADDGGPRADASAHRDASTSSDASTDAGSELTDGGTTSDAGPDIPVDLPGSIDGVEPEAHSNHPPMIDGNGNLYRITESSGADGNQPRMMKSSDGGATWSEVDADHRPEAHDLEGCWQAQHGTAIYLSVAASSRVWWSSFHTSDAEDRPDQWVIEETVDPDLDNGSGVVQFSSHARTSDDRFWLFHSDTLVDGRQQIAFRRRVGADDWSAKEPIGDTSVSWTGPKAVVGASDVTHVFYADEDAHRLYWRTLSAAGALSDATRIDTSGTNDVSIPHTNAVHYDLGGDDVIVIGFSTATGILRAITITDGVVGAEETISTATVLADPDVAENESTVAHLALDGTTVHALWTDLESGDVLHSARPHAGAWSAPEIAWASGDSEAHWVYGNVYVRGGRRRLGFTYDVSPHPDDTGQIEYDEITLTP